MSSGKLIWKCVCAALAAHSALCEARHSRASSRWDDHRRSWRPMWSALVASTGFSDGCRLFGAGERDHVEPSGTDITLKMTVDMNLIAFNPRAVEGGGGNVLSPLYVFRDISVTGRDNRLQLCIYFQRNIDATYAQNSVVLAYEMTS